MTAEIHNCGWKFAVQCPLKWDLLQKTADSDVRLCGTCCKEVFLCTTHDEVRHHASQEHCVAFRLQPANDRDEPGWGELIGDVEVT